MSTLTTHRLKTALTELSESTAKPELDPVDERILDGALRLLDEHGTRMSVNDIAARAGVSRATLFRRFGNKDAVIDRLVLREFLWVTAELERAATEHDDPREALAGAIARALEIGASHPIIQRVARFEPHAFAEIGTEREPSLFAAGRAYLTALIEATLPADPPARDGPSLAETRADILTHLLLAYVMFPTGVFDLTDTTQRTGFARTLTTSLIA